MVSTPNTQGPDRSSNESSSGGATPPPPPTFGDVSPPPAIQVGNAVVTEAFAANVVMGSVSDYKHPGFFRANDSGLRRLHSPNKLGSVHEISEANGLVFGDTNQPTTIEYRIHVPNLVLHCQNPISYSPRY